MDNSFSSVLLMVFLCLAGFMATWTTACRSGVSASPEDLLLSPDPDIRRVAAIEIGNRGLEDRLEDVLLRLNQDPNPLVRAQCATTLSQLGVRSDRVKERLVLALQQDTSPIVQTASLQALATLEFPDAADAIAGRLRNSPDVEVRQEAARALGILGNNRHLPDLIRALKDDSPRVRTTSLESLQEITQKEGPLDAEWWEQEVIE